MQYLAESSGLTFLFYLVVGAFWLIGNLMQQKQQKQAKQKADEMRRQREAREAEEKRTGKKVVKQTVQPVQPQKSDLETFLEKLSGNAPLPATPAPPPPIPRQQTVDDIKFDGPPPIVKPTPPTVKPVQVSAELRRESAIGDLDMAASFKQISDIKEAVEMINGGIDQQLQQDALKTVRSMMIDLSSSSIAVPVIPLQTIRAIRTETPHPDLKKRKTFKKALVASVILETPKALREDPFKGSL